jgi:hypothetical protein
MSQGSRNRLVYAELLTKLYPVLEVTALIRPRLLLMISLAQGHILMGLLYHTGKAAVQSRLCFRATAYPDFSRRTRWRKYGDAQAVATWTQDIVKEFAALATKLGAVATLQLEFLPQASDDEIRQVLMTSPLPTLLL